MSRLWHSLGITCILTYLPREDCKHPLNRKLQTKHRTGMVNRKTVGIGVGVGGLDWGGGGKGFNMFTRTQYSPLH